MNRILTSKSFWLIVTALLIGSFVRFYQLGNLVSPYWEEAALGYDAYSISQTGKDHHGNAWPLVAFESFGDWKPAAYFYAVAIFVKLFGLEVLSVRLPSAIAGVVIIIMTALMAKKFRVHAGAAALIAALSPWGILFSRAAWEVNLGTAFLMTGITAALYTLDYRGGRKFRILLWGISVLAVVASVYTYHALRIVAPLLLGVIILYTAFTEFRTSSPPLKTWVIKRGYVYLLPVILVTIFMLPLLVSLQKPEISLRFSQTSIFTDITVIEESNRLKSLHGNSAVSSILYHRYVLFGKLMLIKAGHHLSPVFLFFSGDNNPRHSVQYFGQLLHIDAILILFGIIYLIKRRNYFAVLLPIWLVITLIPASMTHGTPHALRTLPAAPVFWLVAAGGFSYLLTIRHKLSKYLLISILALIYIVEFTMFWRFYTEVYPKLHAEEWQIGYEEVIGDINSFREQNSNTPIYVTRDFGRPAMYYWFYSKTDPRLVQRADSFTAQDQGEYLMFETIDFGTRADQIDYGLQVMSQVEYDSSNILEKDYKVKKIEIPFSDTGWVILEK